MYACLNACLTDWSASTLSERASSRWSRLVFNGDENNYELWETTFLGHLLLQKLKDTILNQPADGAEENALVEDAAKNAELIQFLDDKSVTQPDSELCQQTRETDEG